jgi:hypothetical protein
VQGLVSSGSKLDPQQMAQKAYEIAIALEAASRTAKPKKTEKPQSLKQLAAGPHKKRSAVTYLDT